MLLGTLAATAKQARSAKSAPVRIKGSYVIAAICRDGIIVASDSRGMLKDKQGRRIAYYDVNQKIFPVGNSMIADTGYASLNDPHISFLSSLMARFAEDPGSRTDIDRLPVSYFKYVDLALPSQGAESAKIQTLVFAGYNHNTPRLCVYRGQSSRELGCRSSGYLSSPNQHLAGLEKVGQLSFAQAARVMRDAIDDYAAAIQPGLVGGPVVIRIITPSNSEWWGRHPAWPRWSSFSDFAQDCKHGLLPMRLMPGVSKAELDSLIDEGDTWARASETSRNRPEPNYYLVNPDISSPAKP